MEASRVRSSPSGPRPHLHVLKGTEPECRLFGISFWWPKVTVTGTERTDCKTAAGKFLLPAFLISAGGGQRVLRKPIPFPEVDLVALEL